jgi:hypothetical protein
MKVRASYWLFVAFVLALGGWLQAPALQSTLFSDDWDHYAMCSGQYPNARAPWDLYNFTSADEAERRALLRSGRLPWWSDPEIQIGFFRPLPSLSVWFDHGVLNAKVAPIRAHLHSLAWWFAGALGVAAVLLRLLPPMAAAVAMLAYAVDDAHALPLAWSAHRGELIAVAIMVWALWAQLRYRELGRSRDRYAALALVCLGMASGEHAVALFAFLAASELGDASRPLRARALGLLPLAAPVLAYIAVRAALGYGVAGSSFYTDPFGEPLRYLGKLTERVPVLAGDLAFTYAADWWYVEPPIRKFLERAGVVLQPARLHTLQWSVGVFALASIVAVWVWLGTRAAPTTARALRFLLAGAMFALVPLSGAIAMTRLTVAPSIAFHAAFAVLVVTAWRTRRAPLIAAAIAVVLLHGVHAAVRGRALARFYADTSHVEADWVARAELGDATLPSKHLIAVSANDGPTRYSLPYVRRFAGRAAPRTSELLLPPSHAPIELKRLDARMIELHTDAPFGFSEYRNSAYRRDDRDFHTGESHASARFTVVITETRHGMPSRLRVVFPFPLEDARYRFVYPFPEGLQQMPVPRTGETLTLPPPAWPRAIGRPIRVHP